ncbi:MAG: 2-succinyl-5-enolpyruvyl-6-hydroxy-3-cyclohexene-1-carboxylic-acid synthase [Firmicutes bacterium]|nr:2-succinyl-5-enolpyruvyl-6-hydroxy-3-cyclohexene-1-carboxylic-acid synthase [Bacillota bacterium]
MTSSEILSQYVTAFVRQLERSGVDHAVICPGSRSTPLALALIRSTHIRHYVLLDERSAGFFALGLSKRLQRPTVLLATSGTATAEFAPAVAEAAISRVPLLVLTADRPRELRDVGAPQTIDQVRLYGSHTKWFQDMPTPDGREDLVRFVQIAAARAVHLSLSGPQGPVQLNFPFHDPLIIDRRIPPLAPQNDLSDLAIYNAALPVSINAIEAVLSRIPSESQGLLIAGPGTPEKSGQALIELSRHLGWPLLADPLSNLRHMDGPLINTYDTIVRRPDLFGALRPQIVVRTGAAPTSKALNQATALLPQVIVDEETGSWRDPNLHSVQMIYGSIESFSRQLTAALKASPYKAPVQWLDLWQQADRQIHQRFASLLNTASDNVEPYLYYHLAQWIPTDRIRPVFASNSMPIRDVDTFSVQPAPHLRFYGNRGANGIDGIISTALGVAAVDGDVVAVLGDLAFYHDMNGLLAGKLHQLNALIVVINNDGGGIFSFLPQARQLSAEEFEVLFGTPHHLTFAPAAALYGGLYRYVETPADLHSAFADFIARPGLRIIEWRPINRQANVQRHQYIMGLTETKE